MALIAPPSAINKAPFSANNTGTSEASAAMLVRDPSMGVRSDAKARIITPSRVPPKSPAMRLAMAPLWGVHLLTASRLHPLLYRRVYDSTVQLT